MNNWQTEVNNSVYWLIIALACVSIGLYLTGKLVGRTAFGQKFWHITKPCWEKSNKIKTVGLVLLLLLMVLMEVRISVLNTFFTTACTARYKNSKLMPSGFLRSSI